MKVRSAPAYDKRIHYAVNVPMPGTVAETGRPLYPRGALVAWGTKEQCESWLRLYPNGRLVAPKP